MGRTTLCVLLAIVSGLMGALCGCGNEAGPAGPAVVATEIWTVDVGGGQGHGDFTFIKRSNGVVTATGSWTFGAIFSPFSSAAGGEIDSVISFAASGIATNDTAQSDFSLTVAGKAAAGSANGTYSIVYAQGWQVPGPLTWTASRTSGSGITP